MRVGEGGKKKGILGVMVVGVRERRGSERRDVGVMWKMEIR